MVTKSLYFVRAQDHKFPTYDGLTIIDEFLTKFEIAILEHQWFNAMRWALCVTPVRWWGTHEGTFEYWCAYRRMMKIRFWKPKLHLREKYDGRDDSGIHLTRWTKAYREEPQPERVHLFYHTLDVIPRKWYTEEELWHDTGEWDILREEFLSTFLFEDQWMDPMDEALQVVEAAIFKTPLEPEETMQPNWLR